MATAKIGYGTEVTLTCTLTSLASSSGLTVGRQSTVVSNTSTLAVDYLLAGKIKVGASNMTANTTAEIWVFSEMEDTPTYPDTFGATDAGVTITSRNVLFGHGKLAGVIAFDGTDANRVYHMGQTSVASLFGGICPRNWGIFVVHNGGNALSSTETDHRFYAMPILPTVA